MGSVERNNELLSSLPSLFDGFVLTWLFAKVRLAGGADFNWRGIAANQFDELRRKAQRELFEVLYKRDMQAIKRKLE